MMINKLKNYVLHKKASKLACLSALLLGSISFLQAQPRQIDRVIVVVDDAVILKSELEERYSATMQQIAERNIAAPPEDVLREQLLDALIVEQLQLQMAFRAGIRVDDNMLNQAMSDIAQQNNMDFNQFRQVLEANGAYNQTREQIRRDILVNQLQSGAVNQRISVTRQEIENYLQSEVGQTGIAPEYKIAHILIPATTASEASRQEELGNLLFQQIAEEEIDIIQIAAARNVSGIAVSGGELAWNKVEGLPNIFGAVVPELEVGAVAEPFTSSAGIHIVQLLAKRGGADLKLDQAHVRHILIRPTEIRTEEQAETFIRELHQRILDGEDFADIARQNTDDENSMVSGGDLEWINDGQLPEDYMAQVHATEVGEMTEPFRASTGWHILEVLGRRVEDVTQENARYQAEQILRNRKFEAELQNWLTEIHDMAYIDIKE